MFPNQPMTIVDWGGISKDERKKHSKLFVFETVGLQFSKYSEPHILSETTTSPILNLT